MEAVKTDIQFPLLEKAILDFWRRDQIMEKGLKANEGKEPFVFYDGPPFATGLPHYGHMLPGALKDIVPRYWVMKGRYVQRRWGWDCHGLPVEFEMEKELGLSGLRDIEKYGVANFNEACRAIVLRYTEEWKRIILRTGRWVDFENQYRTMDPSFMESVWWVIQQLWKKGLIVEGYRVMPYSWRITTPLSNFEANLNYKEVQDPAITVAFKSLDRERELLAWTTTPWTLPSNLALAVHPEARYLEVVERESGKHYVVGKDRVSAYFKDEASCEVIAEFSGQEFVGERYEPLFPFFASLDAKGAFRVLAAEYVTTTDGTGIVHNAPAFGEEDFETCARHGIPLVDPTDAEGKFTDLAPPYRGLPIKEADRSIIRDLKEKGRVFRHETIVHSYPFCWRSDTPLMNKAISTWFVKLDPIKANLIANNRKTHWVPEHIKEGRFGNWLDNARDWNISRNRFWGTPIPVWRCEAGCGHELCLGSIAELQKLSGASVTDLHKHFIDPITFPCEKCGGVMRRIPEVLDCWFESGSMPYGQAHYPFENRESFEKTFPAQFISEGIDQTRGWFYTLSVLGTALFDRAPFQNVIVGGLILAEDGKKMSKRLKNYPDPLYILDTYGADALRAYLMTSPASRAEDLRFSEAGVKEVVRSVLLPYWNAYSFFVTYARADEWSPDQFSEKTLGTLTDSLDRWILSRLQTLIRTVEEKMAIYHLYEVVPAVVNFIDELTNWYIRLNRRRFWSEGDSDDKRCAYATLYFTLTQFSRVLAPILPFVTEAVYQNLERTRKGAAESVHLSRFPEQESKWVSPDLEQDFALVQEVVSMGRNLRNVHKLKTRQPLRELTVITKVPSDRETIERFQGLITAELNVKKVSFSSEESRWVALTAKANAKVLGPRLGTKMKAVLQGVRDLASDAIERLEREGSIELEGERIELSEVVIERKPLQAGLIQSNGILTVWLDSTLDEKLVREGQAREFVNRVQKIRKDLNFDVTDRIRVRFETTPEIAEAVASFRDYITGEILATDLGAGGATAWTSEQEIDGFPLKISVERV